VALTWVSKMQPRVLRRLQLATERGRTLGFVFRALTARRESSSAVLRLAVEPAGRSVDQRARITLLKSRGGLHGCIELSWPLPV
jgi:hypothetical protein